MTHKPLLSPYFDGSKNGLLHFNSRFSCLLGLLVCCTNIYFNGYGIRPSYLLTSDTFEQFDFVFMSENRRQFTNFLS